MIPAPFQLQAVWHLLCESSITRKVSWTLSTRRFAPATRWSWTANRGAPWFRLSFKWSQSSQWEVVLTSKMYLQPWIKWWVLISSTLSMVLVLCLWNQPWAELEVWWDSKGTSTCLILSSIGLFQLTQHIIRSVAHPLPSSRRITHLSSMLQLLSSQHR